MQQSVGDIRRRIFKWRSRHPLQHSVWVYLHIAPFHTLALWAWTWSSLREARSQRKFELRMHPLRSRSKVFVSVAGQILHDNNRGISDFDIEAE
jgi:hypothetical protein